MSIDDVHGFLNYYASDEEVDTVVNIVKGAFEKMADDAHDAELMLAVLDCYLARIRSHVACEAITPDDIELAEREGGAQ